MADTLTTLAETILRDVPRYPHNDDADNGFCLLETEVIAALTAAMDPAIADRAGAVVERLNFFAAGKGTVAATSTKAADLLTALLAQNAALRAERDALAVTVAGWQEMAKGNAERGAKIGNDLIARAEAAGAQNAALTARVEGLTGALGDLLNAYSKPDERLCCDGRECGCHGATERMQAEYYAREELSKGAALSATTEEGHE